MRAFSGGILQWAPNEQNIHFKELRKKVGIKIQDMVNLKGIEKTFETYFSKYCSLLLIGGWPS